MTLQNHQSHRKKSVHDHDKVHCLALLHASDTCFPVHLHMLVILGDALAQLLCLALEPRSLRGSLLPGRFRLKLGLLGLLQLLSRLCFPLLSLLHPLPGS